jgi:hypothetical protein
MYEFLDRLVSVALPRVRDFKELATRALMEEATTLWVYLSKSFSLKLDIDKVSIRSMVWISRLLLRQIRMLSAFSLLTELGLPFKKELNTEWQKNQ